MVPLSSLLLLLSPAMIDASTIISGKSISSTNDRFVLSTHTAPDTFNNCLIRFTGHAASIGKYVA